MGNTLDYANQCSRFCYLRYEFFKRSKAYSLVHEVMSNLLTIDLTNTVRGGFVENYLEFIRRRPPAVFYDELIEVSKKISEECYKAVELDLTYNQPWNGTWTIAYTTKEGTPVVKSGPEVTIFDCPHLMGKTFDIPISLKEIISIEDSIDQIKIKIQNHFKKEFPSALGIPEKLMKWLRFLRQVCKQ